MLLLVACAPLLPDVVLVSLDTTRADMIDPATAPNIDALATVGARFEWALTHAPTTLSSHASVFTGLDPHRHGVVRNGHPLATDLPTLAERFAAAGYDTIGIAGASALDGSMEVGRGFRVWDDTFSVDRGRRHEALASDVTDRALARLARRGRRKPLFLFVHYYDAHSPYDAPAPWTHRWSDTAYGGYVDGTPEATHRLQGEIADGSFDPADLAELRARYRGEVSWVDSEVGRLLRGLDGPSRIVAVFGDHGEMFGETQARPFGHGADVDLAVSHVPLILSGRGVPRATVDTAVGLQDLGATLLSLAGLPGALGDGQSLERLWKGGAGRDVLMEATQPDTHERKDAWPNLDMERGIASDGHLLVRAPWLAQGPRLHRLATGQPAADDPARAAAMGAALDAWDAAAPGWSATPLTPEMREALEALGYVEPR